MSFMRRLRLALLPPSFMPNMSGHPPSPDPQEYEREPVTEDPEHHQKRHRFPDVEVADAGEVRLHVEVHGRVDGASSRGRVDDVEHLERVYTPEDDDDDEEGAQQGHDEVPHLPRVARPVHP